MKTVLITGCSSGIGYQLALEFAKRGYLVFACARSIGPLQELASKYPENIIPFTLDISSLDSINRGYEFVKFQLEERKLDGLDVLYNNAGSSCTFPAIDVPDQALVQCLEVNIAGHVRMTHAFSRLVIARKGTIAFTGSAAGYCPFPWGSVYGASKAAIGQYASILAFELEPFDVKVKHFITGGVKTNIADKRPLPEDSIYNIESMRVAFEERQKFAERNNPLPADVYAKQAVDAIEKGWRSTVDVYLGTWRSLPRIVAIVPRWLILTIFRVKFHLHSVWRELRHLKSD
ncbi:hypothetical protein CAS74_002063 [Pichia kudriavzevii]|uniref:NADPH-dependent 1-acyldihydroxyacetone phosphate reductase n=1 Tax=Pichia kudriavzevii TaxID=4909 RepID=A0A1Z8JP34_PICKU|nr:hypothetical protein CAS74_002063 [Pichia kudriavzevii]